MAVTYLWLHPPSVAHNVPRLHTRLFPAWQALPQIFPWAPRSSLAGLNSNVTSPERSSLGPLSPHLDLFLPIHLQQP